MQQVAKVGYATRVLSPGLSAVGVAAARRHAAPRRLRQAAAPAHVARRTYAQWREVYDRTADPIAADDTAAR